jgi:hypothetical protein
MKRILTIEQLEELFAKNDQEPITLRNLSRHLRFNREEIISFLQLHSTLFGAAIRRPTHGGKKSTVIFLRSNPPLGLRKPKPKTPIAVTTRISWPSLE